MSLDPLLGAEPVIIVHAFAAMAAFVLGLVQLIGAKGTLPGAVYAARKHKVNPHKYAMISIFTGALMIAGAFTFLPGRIMHDVVFGR